MEAVIAAMVAIVFAGLCVMAVATVAHLFDRFRRLRQLLRARFVSVAAWTYRVRRETGHRLTRVNSPTN